MHLYSNSEGAKIPLWLDCDPGNDDVFAILLAAFLPYFDLLGISTVHGNVLLEKTTHNAVALLDVLEFKQDEIKVYVGSEKPLAIKPIHAESVHGITGIGGATLPKKPRIEVSSDMGYLEAMRQAILSHAEQICVVCTGALTNFAKLITKYPEVCDKIRYVSIMGGAIGTGNITPTAEFNIYCDPHAADVVFKEPGLANKIILTPLNLTHTVLATPSVREAIRGSGIQASSTRDMFSKIIAFYFEHYKECYDDIAGPPVHDPLAVFLLIAMLAREEPSLSHVATVCDFHYLQRNVEVVVGGNDLGKTVIVNGDLDPLKHEKNGIYIGMNVNRPFFWESVIHALELADRQVKNRQSRQ